MTPAAFVAKWRNASLKERSAAQEHFIDLCRLIGHPTPAETDPKGEWFAFEKGATKTGGGEGWADVWKKGCFAWEYKGQHKDLKAALRQLQQYALALENPPLLVVCDLSMLILHTQFTNSVHEFYPIRLEDLADSSARLGPKGLAPLDILRFAFGDPERLKPGRTTEQVTAEAAARFAELTERLRNRGHPPPGVAQFLNQLLFCLFAEDTGLLPTNLFARLIDRALKRPADFPLLARNLFEAMRGGGYFGVESLNWFESQYDIIDGFACQMRYALPNAFSSASPARRSS